MKRILVFESMTTFYSNGVGGFYEGDEEVLVAHVDQNAKPKDIKKQGLSHLKVGRVYLADMIEWTLCNPLKEGKGWSKKMAKLLQEEWDKNPTSKNLPIFLKKKHKDFRTLLKYD